MIKLTSHEIIFFVSLNFANLYFFLNKRIIYLFQTVGLFNFKGNYDKERQGSFFFHRTWPSKYLIYLIECKSATNNNYTSETKTVSSQKNYCGFPKGQVQMGH